MGNCAVTEESVRLSGPINALEGLIYSEALPKGWVLRHLGDAYWIECSQPSAECRAMIKLVDVKIKK